MAAVGIAGGPREQQGCALGPAVVETLVLAAGGVLELLADRDKRLPVHLVVEAAQIGGSAGVADQAAARQPSASPMRSPQRIKMTVISR